MNITHSARTLMLLVSGPAGSGKTTLCTRMCETYSNVKRVVTTTTRPPREGEVEGEDYYFLSADQFEEKLEKGEFFEHAKVHSRFYGTTKAEIHNKLNSGSDVLINIDVQGAATIRKQAEEDPELHNKLITVFVAPTSMDELYRRLSSRAQDDEQEIKRRLKNAEAEMAEWKNYNYFIPSGTRDKDFGMLSGIYEAEKLRVV